MILHLWIYPGIKIYLPHTYNSEDSANSAYYRGITCYRRRLALSKEYADKALYWEFGAADTIADVYVNGILAGRHKGGYSAFRVNITDLVRFDKVYSNAQNVELTINGKQSGVICRKDLPKGADTVFVWNNISLDREENIVVVKGVSEDRMAESDRMV